MVISGFNQLKSSSITIAIGVDISKAFDTASHRLFIEMIHHSRLRHTQFSEVVCGIPPRQEGLEPVSAAPLAFPPGAGRGPTGIRHLPSPLQLLCVGLPNVQFKHNVLHWRLHAAGLCSKHRGGRGEGRPTMFFFSGEVGRGQATGHCSPEILRDTVHLWHSPVPTPPSYANRWHGGPVEQNP